ncbi:hypothetical protein [Hyphococcus sp.]|uniref:hypothetical protein n=1 Tax=Hyphococcus sp. TaxID=2038636 RepID=UPI003CCBEA0C
MTIYRALEALITKGYVKKIASLNAFAAISPGCESGARAFLICRNCMRAKEVMLDEARIADLFSPLEVTADNLTIEVFGECHQVCGERKNNVDYTDEVKVFSALERQTA